MPLAHSLRCVCMTAALWNCCGCNCVCLCVHTTDVSAATASLSISVYSLFLLRIAYLTLTSHVKNRLYVETLDYARLQCGSSCA